MPINQPFQISESAEVNFYKRFTDRNKGFNVQYAATRNYYAQYSVLPPINVDYNLTTSQQLVEGQWDAGTLFGLMPGAIFPVFQYFCPNAHNNGDEKNHTFGGRLPIVLMVHLSYPNLPPQQQFGGRISLLANCIQDTIIAMFATTDNYTGSSYQAWPQPQLAPNSLSSTSTDILVGARGLMQAMRFDMLFDRQTSS